MGWQFSGDRPIYTQLVEQIERQLITGTYPPGSRLPGVRELAAQAGVNPNTMQRALTDLEARGYLYSHRTSGRFVCDDPSLIAGLRHHLAEKLTDNYLRDMAALGCGTEEIQQLVAEAGSTLGNGEEPK